MPKINEKEFIDEIIFCIHQSDIIKAKALVQFFGEVNPKTQNRVLYELSKSTDEIAYPVLDYLCEINGREKQLNAVDDSTMMLKLYKKLLHAMDYNPVLFQLPVEVIKAVHKKT